MASVISLKRAVRTEVKRRLRDLSAQEKLRQSRCLTRKVIEHSKYLQAERVAVFLSMQNEEVHTEDIIKDIFQRGKVCFIPRYKAGSDHMDMVRLASVEEVCSLPLTSWNIRQPAEEDAREEALCTGGLDLMLVPGLAFDKYGNRLGRGKGYYDRYLQRCKRHSTGQPYTIALAFTEQLCEHVPAAENDVKIDEILFEESQAL